MRIISISLQNIKSHRDLELQFVNGINVLSGVNGAGKSTIFEAVGYALFGVDARDFVGNIERFITIGEKKGEIRVVFETDKGERFQASRSVGTGSKWLLAKKQNDTFEVEDHTGAVETETRIKELLGLDSGRSLAEQFKLVIGPFQNEFLGPFILKQPRKRQEAFDEILGIDAWRKTYKGTSTLQAAVKSKIEVLVAEIEGREKQAAVLPDKEKELLEYISVTKTLQKELTENEKNLTKLHKQLITSEELEKKVTAIRTESKILENRLTDGKGKIQDQKKLVTGAELAIQKMDKCRKGKEAYEAADLTLQSLRKKEKQRRAIEQEISSLDKECARLMQLLEHETGEVEKTTAQLSNEGNRLQEEKKASVLSKPVLLLAKRLPELRNEADKIRSARGLLEGRRKSLLDGQEKLTEGTCPFFQEQCQNITSITPQNIFSAKVEEMDKEILKAEEQIKELSQKILAAEKAKQDCDSHKIRVQELDKQLQTLEQKREENNNRKKKLEETRVKKTDADKNAAVHRKELNKFKELDTEIVKVEKQRTENQEARDKFFSYQRDAQDLKQRQDSLEKMVMLFDELQITLGKKQEELTGLEKDYDAKQHEKLRLEKEKLVAAIATVQQKIGGIDKDRKRIEEEINKLQQLTAEIKAKQAEKNKFSAIEKQVKFLRNKIFNNVSLQLSERFREEISIRADKIYRTIAETDESLFWGENYQIILRDMHNGKLRERTDDQLSGGQIMSAVVALRLALLQTIGARIAFFDEPTSNLDAVRRENLAHAFRAIDIGREEVTDRWYDQLFLISHDVAFTEVTDQIISLDPNH